MKNNGTHRDYSILEAAGLRKLSILLLIASLAFLSGCSHIDITEQRLLSKPNMIFSDSSIYSSNSGFIGRVEPGSSSAGGAQASGCTSCK